MHIFGKRNLDLQQKKYSENYLLCQCTSVYIKVSKIISDMDILSKDRVATGLSEANSKLSDIKAKMESQSSNKRMTNLRVMISEIEKLIHANTVLEINLNDD